MSQSELRALFVGFVAAALVASCAGGGDGTNAMDGRIAPPPAHPDLISGDAGGADVAGELADHDAGAAGDVGQFDAGVDGTPEPPPCDPSAAATVGNRILFCSTTSTLAGHRCAVCCTSDQCETFNRIGPTCVLSADVICVTGNPTCSFAGCSP